MSHLFRRIGPVGCTCTAVRWGFAVGTNRSICYLNRNTSSGGEVSRTWIKKVKSFAKELWFTSAAALALLGTTTLRSATTLPLVLELAVPCVIWKGTQVEEERWVARWSTEKNEIICKNYVDHLCSHVIRTGPDYVKVRGNMDRERQERGCDEVNYTELFCK